MPGSRLNQQDRRQIAAGLADGLSYTEIARSLDRPVSTVTREVMRNGGPHAYRAEQAHRATERRARRRPAPQQAPPDPTPAVDSASVRDFAERFTELLVATGIPRMMAAVLACLYTSPAGNLTTAELVQRLKVSPASISKAVGYLEGQELIRRERDAQERRDRYVIDEDVWFRAMLASARMNAALAEAAQEGAGILGAATPAATRLADMGRFLDRVGQDLVRSAEHWREVFAEERHTRE
ncbi:helix-turn-helix domain-containing protein [Streptomyces sp. NPDC055721]|uniref:GbsR/MarR family transcriptional regulator n=1 Tax=Streptomyces sp. NPDC127132 TaxID=3345374 RepID=UPI0036284DED